MTGGWCIAGLKCKGVAGLNTDPPLYGMMLVVVNSGVGFEPNNLRERPDRVGIRVGAAEVVDGEGSIGVSRRMFVLVVSYGNG